MRELTEEGREIVAEVAERHRVSGDAASTLLRALLAGHGTQAQFSHPDLGGMGQWSRGGMIMVGDMFNHGLKQRVDALCTELSDLMDRAGVFALASSAGTSPSETSLFVADPSSSRWPAELGSPSSTGSQNNLHYAVFPATRRLAIKQGEAVTVYDTGDHRIGGFSQQQGGGQSLTFTSQHGVVRVADLPRVSNAVDGKAEAGPAAEPKPSVPPPSSPRTFVGDDIFAKIERLADLHARGTITASEFEAKKTDLLGRL